MESTLQKPTLVAAMTTPKAKTIVGVATEIGIEPTIRHAADLGYIPILVTDACGAGHAEAGERALASIKFMGDAILTDVQSIRRVLRRFEPGRARA